jgi:hypothetical protein
VAVAGCRWGLRRALTHPATGGSRPGSRRRGIRTIPGLPAALGAATLKECRYLSRTLDMILGTLFAWGAAVWLLLQSEPNALALLAGIGALVSETAMPMNAFGLDRGAVDRYRILPLSGREVLLSKNLAFFIVAAIQVVPLCIAAAFAFGPAESLACLFGFATFALALLMLGNGLSVSEPMPREFFNFDSKEQTGGILGLLYAMLIWVVPAGVGLLARLAGPFVLVGAEALLFGGAVVFYRRLLTGAGRLFEASAETMRARLAR